MNSLILRKADLDDSEFAYQTKKAAFKEYVERVYDWNEDEQRQLHAQRFKEQDIRVINLDNTDVGVIAIAAAPDYVKVNQLFILPEHQSKGIGQKCMAAIMKEANQLGLPISLRVMKVNPRAFSFYERLGFACCGETETHHLMEWHG